MFKKKDLAIAITIALCISPASFAQAPMDEPVEQTPETGTNADVITKAGKIPGVSKATLIAGGLIDSVLIKNVVINNGPSSLPTTGTTSTTGTTATTSTSSTSGT
ncbi:MAG: hypothetical protein P8P31_02135 [Porticoccaceae bacterium]|nr:hypothetical protein [Porticoccaceae bacterium]